MGFKKSISLVAFVFATINIFAQNKISGNIKDDNKENLAGVSIYFTDLKTGISTDKDGNYQMINLKSGTYLLDISFVGYKSIVKQVTITKDTIMDFVLVSAVSELNEVIVTGVSRSTELKLNPVIVKTIDRNTLNQNSSTNLIDGLKNIPGFSQITTGAAISKPTIRGLGYNRIITLNNGIRQEGQQWGDEHGIEMDEYAVDRAEIVKGPGSLMYGSDGIAGVLNFLAPKAPPIGEIKTQLISNYQSNNNLIGYSLSNAGSKNGFQWLGRFSNKFAGNYQNAYDGKVLNSGFREFDGSIFLGINKSWGHSHLTVSSFNQTLNLPEGERDSLGRFTYVNANGDDVTATSQDYSGYKIGFPHQEINHLRVSSNNYFILKKGTINADLGFQNNKRKEFGDPTNPNDIALFFDLNTFNYNIRYNLEKKKGWETSFGISGMQQSNTNRGLEFLIPAYNHFDAGAFVFTQKTFKKLTIAGGLRFDNRYVNSKELYLDSLEKPVSIPDANSELKFSSFAKNYNSISGSIGLSYQINKTSTLKFNISRGFRAPNIAELASNGRHEGTFRYEIGNPNLKSETSHQIDIAYFLNSEHITFELTPFVNFISNYIFTEKLKGKDGNDSIPDPNDPAPAYKFMSGNATLLGAEIYFDVHPHPLDWLHLENSFSYVQATQHNKPDGSKYLPFIPAPKYRGEIKAQFKNFGKILSNAYVKFGVDYFFAQNKFFSATGTETATPAYTLLSAGIGANIKGFKRKDFMSLYISGENLADVAYQNHLSRLKYAPENLATGRNGIFNMGRNVSVKLIMTF
jgi:iron complex outermembrane receptor protein